MYQCYLTCPRGLEKIAQGDIAPFANSIKIDQGGIQFQTNQAGIYKTNIHSRVGMHLLVELFNFDAKDSDALYNHIYDFSWDKWIDPKQTFAVKVRGYSDQFNRNYTTLKIKDSIVDHIRKKKLSRPSIDKNNPDIIISVFVSENHFKVYIDSSGVSLHKRGYRNKIHKAALNEALAAGLVMLSNWDKSSPFYDTMCGSGTIAIEAALIAHNIAPGLLRNTFSFQNWEDYDENLFKNITNEAKKNIKIDKNIKIYGFDLQFANIAMALYSCKSLGLEKSLTFKKQDMQDFEPQTDKGTLIINPPYGERLNSDDGSIDLLYAMIGDIFKNKCTGFDCYVFSANLEAVKSIRLKTQQKLVLKNGSLDSRLLYYPIEKGTYNKKGS